MQLPSPLGQNPSLPSPFYQSAFSNLGGTNSKVLSADSSNSVQANNVLLGFNVPVVANIPVTVQFCLAIVSAGAGGVRINFVHPGVSGTGLLNGHGNSSNANIFTDGTVAIGASPFTLVLGSSFMTYAGNGYILISASFVPSASGNVDISFGPAVDTQNVTVKAGSSAKVF